MCRICGKYKLYRSCIFTGYAVCRRCLCADDRSPYAFGRDRSCIPGNFYEAGSKLSACTGLSGIVPICTECGHIRICLYNHRFYHRNVPDSGIRTSYGTAGCTFQLLRRRNCRYICKPGRRKTRSHDRMYRPRNLYYLPAGDALTDACRHRIHQYDLYGCGYGSDRLPVHAV